jgi:hypothetical protein
MTLRTNAKTTGRYRHPDKRKTNTLNTLLETNPKKGKVQFPSGRPRPPSIRNPRN